MLQEREFSFEGLTLAALEWPGDGVPILALHGWLDNAASFEPLAPLLAPHHLVAIDMPGHGHSDHLPGAANYHLVDSPYWIQSVIDALGWSRFILLGHSMGSASAVLCAVAMPQRVAGLSLIDGLGPLAFTPQQEAARLRKAFEGPNVKKEPRQFSSIQSASKLRQRLSRFPISYEAAESLSKRSLRQSGDGYSWRYDERLIHYTTHYYSEEQSQGVLSEISMPTQLLSATEGALSGWGGFAARRDALKGLEHHVLPGGHHVHMESPEMVASHLKRFYAGLNEE